MIRVTRRYKFCASHRLHSGEFSDDENKALYGKCNNPYGHGHDYVLEVSVSGPVDATTGQIIPVGKLDRLVHSAVLSEFETRNLNLEVADFSEKFVPTSENILKVIKNRLRARWASEFPGESPQLERIRLQETKRNSFEVTA